MGRAFSYMFPPQERFKLMVWSFVATVLDWILLYWFL